jgi:hypothetical protein
MNDRTASWWPQAANEPTRIACPMNYEMTVCETCGRRAPHRVEMIVFDDPDRQLHARFCELHRMALVRVPQEGPTT